MSLVKSAIQNKYGQWTYCMIEENDYISEHLQWYEIMNPSCKEELKLAFPYKAWLQNVCWEELRTLYGKPLRVTSGYRSPSFNKEHGGVDNSLHLTCEAYDNSCNVTDNLWTQLCLWCSMIAYKHDTQCELGRYSWGFHVGFSKLTYTNKLLYTFDKR